MASYGVTAAGFVLKPFAQILADYQAAFLANIDPGLDLSPTSPEGQLLTILSNADAQLWELAQTCYNEFNRQAAEGAALDNLGDLVGNPREGSSYTQVLCNLTWTDSGTVHAIGSLVANVDGAPTLTFSNAVSVTSNGGTSTGILFQAQTIGSTPTINPNTLVDITVPVSGWASITNSFAQTQLGANEEIDAAYAARQDAELGAVGACNISATAAALLELGASQSPPVPLTVSVIENTTDVAVTVGSLVIPPHCFAPIVYDPTSTLTDAQIGQVVYDNMPPGIGTVGTSAVVVADPNLGNQTVFFTRPAPKPLYVVMTVAIRPNFVFATVATAIPVALEQAATAITPPGGIAPLGQFAPGSPAVGSQLEAVVSSVPGMFDVQSLAFGFSPTPTNVGVLTVDPTHIITIATANITVNPGSYP